MSPKFRNGMQNKANYVLNSESIMEAWRNAEIIEKNNKKYPMLFELIKYYALY